MRYAESLRAVITEINTHVKDKDMTIGQLILAINDEDNQDEGTVSIFV